MPGGALYSALFPSDMHALPLRSELDAIVAALQRNPGDVWNQLLSTARDARVRELFEVAREEQTQFVLPDEVVFPTQYPIYATLDARTDTSIFIEDANELRSLTLPREWSDAPRMDTDRPGIYRLQHASVLYRSEAGTGIIVDPVAGLEPHDWISPQHMANIDAILISHSHRDHFSVLTLMQFPRETLVIVPRVERSSMLCLDMEAVLRDAGFTNVIVADWYSRVRVKDIEVSAYPFYGEQPWIDFAAPVAELRNQGNTYVVDMDGHKSWLLVDSGQEFEHSMSDLCDRVRDENGPIDLVLSNLRDFLWHPKQVDASGRYLLCFPEEILAAPERWPSASSTFGADGMRRFLDALKPRYFAPYAHWWHPREQTSHPVDGQTENELLAAIATGHTTLRSWQVGDLITVE